MGVLGELNLPRLILPIHCVVCRDRGASLCPGCAALLAPPPVAPAIAGLDRTVALFAYEGAGRTVIARLKYENHRDSLRPLATMLAAAIDEPVDLVTWVPTTAGHRRRRGFDQAELIARAVGRSLGVPVRATVRRADGGAQTGRARAARLTTRFEPLRAVPEPCVAVVDDVRTTGASLGAVGRAVHAAGARRVVGATFAATPRSLPLPRSDPLQSS